MATIDSNTIANQAIQLMGDDMPPKVTGQWPNFGGSPAAETLNILYGACLATMQRQAMWDASRNLVALVASGNVGPFPAIANQAYTAKLAKLRGTPTQ